MKNFFKNHYVELLCFIIPIVIFAIACFFCDIWPLGNKYIVAYDGSAQYPGFTTYLSNVLRGSESFLYSFKGGLGYNFYTTAIYYLFNPTNLLSIFFNKDSIMVFYTLIVFLRIGLCGLTMGVYLKHKNSKSKTRIIFAIAYALMAYNTVYFYNFMYFDNIVLFPLVILGLDKLIEKSNPKLYIIFLSLTIISNFYIGYMICIFCLLYFIYKGFVLKSFDKKTIKTFIISSLLSGLICTFILLPVFFELMNGKVSVYGQSYTIYNEWNMDFFASIYKLSIANYESGDQINGYPNIYTSMLVFVYFILYFFNTKYTKKEKIFTGLFLAFFLLCFSFNFLDYAWQFFQKPIWYPNRYSFIFSFFLIIIAFKGFTNKKTLNISLTKQIILIFILTVLLMGSAYYCGILTKNKTFLIFLGLSIICIFQYVLASKRKIIPIIFYTVFFFEIIVNTLMNVKQISFPKQVDEFTKINDNFSQTFEYIQKNDSPINNFYRADSEEWMNINNASSYNYNGLLYFNSLRNGTIMDFLEHYAGYTVKDQCSTRFNAANPVFTSMLNFKYIISSSEQNYYSLLNDSLHYKVYKNEEFLSLGFMTNSNIKNIELKENEYHLNSSKIVNYSSNKYNNILKIKKYDKLIGYNMEIKDDKNFITSNSKEGGYISFSDIADDDYFILIDKKLNSNGLIVLYVDGIKQNLKNTFTPYTISKNSKYEIKYYLSSSISEEDLKIYLLNINEYKSWIEEMKKNQLEIIEYTKDHYIKAKIIVTKNKKTLFTSIPYDKSWTIFVDGKKTKVEKLLDAFIGFDLEEGEHIIEFKFFPRGLALGGTISILAILVSIIYIKKKTS